MTSEERIADPDASAAELAAAARALEAAGRSVLAMRAWQRVVQLDPGCRDAWLALATLHDERGDPARAAACRARVGAPEVRPPSPEPEAPREGFTDADLVRFAWRFAGREGTHARMWRSGDEIGWSPVQGALTPDLARAHLEGAMTLGSYVLRADGTAGWVVVDLDVAKAALLDPARAAAARALVHRSALSLVDALRVRGVDALLEDSGFKGRHVWCFFDAPVDGAEAFVIARALAAMADPGHADVRVDAFPRQPSVREGGLGSLVKLPLGLHLRSGRRGTLLGATGEPLADPWARLVALQTTAPSCLPHDAPARAEAVPPVVPVPPRAWTTADFDTDPRVGPVVRGCAVLRAVVENTLRERRITRAESAVLSHSLGHLPEGPKAVNYVLDHVPGLAPEARMGAPHRGQPISCQRVRQRLPEIADRVGCDCALDVPPGGYAHPLLHRPDGPARTDRELCLARWTRLEARARELSEELDAARLEVVALLRELPDRRWAGDGGDWVLTDEAGAPRVRWEPWPSSR